MKLGTAADEVGFGKLVLLGMEFGVLVLLLERLVYQLAPLLSAN